MISSVKIRQFLEIIRYIKAHPGCSRAEILEALDRVDIGMSRATFERTKAELINLGFEVKYDNGYTVEQDDSEFFKDADEFLHTIVTFGYWAESVKDISLMKPSIRFTESSIKGQQHLPTLLYGCIEQKLVTFDHYSYQFSRWESKKLEPYQLREEQGRWYVIGVIVQDGKRKVKSYGLDRIEHVVKTDEVFAREPQFEPDLVYKDVIGVWSEVDKSPERIVLEIDQNLWQWIESTPWHPSQELLSEKDGRVQFGLFVKQSLDLHRKIFAWTPHITVIEPHSLKTHMAEVYRKGMENNS